MPLEHLESNITDRSGIFVPPGEDANEYFSSLESSIRANLCAPFEVTAEVTAPGFPDKDVGSIISGWCVAHSEGYWLVSDSERDTFYCFWGKDPENLGAPGIFGSPMYCWSA